MKTAAQAATPTMPALSGDLNLVFPGLRLRGLNGPTGMIRMGGWARTRYNREVASWVGVALSKIGTAALSIVQDEKKRIRIMVRHRGVFDPDALPACAKPLVDALKPRRIRVAGRVLAVEPGLLHDDSPEWLELEVLQRQGTYHVTVECWSLALAHRFGGVTVTVGEDA